MKYYIGIDISKKRLDVDWLGEPILFMNNTIRIDQFITLLQSLLGQNQLALGVCEASSGYEQKLVRPCHLANVPIHVF